ncbi:hypothetical protein [Serratia sp. DD3]|uniref:hypothetical protein n=1 Tax=Serratia sp. DD3 TaxID=1410619 RepID=UPI001F385E86|nr:hypothetical protein [Serratia sp. DD3]
MRLNLSILLTTAIMLFPALSPANMRAPNLIWQPPSFSLSSPQSNKFKVKREKLNIDCDYENCQVQAVYEITSDIQADVAFVFVMPANTPVSARVNGTLQPATVTLDEINAWKLRNSDTREYPLYKAAFTGQVSIGTNTINIKYNQPLTLLERDYGYFTDSRSIEQFSYQLGPLKEWPLADDFSLDVTLSSLRKRPERDGGWSILKSRTIDCMQPEQKIEKDSEHLNLTVKFGKKFPDTLICKIGDSDLLEEK